MDLEAHKWMIVALLFVHTFGLTLATYIFVAACRRNPNRTTERWTFSISLLNCFAGGVFMATGLLDIFPEVIKTVEVRWKHGYPIAEFFVALGFLLVLTIEQIVLYVKEKPLTIPTKRDGGNQLDTQSDHEGRVLLSQPDEYVEVHGSLSGVSDHPVASSSRSTPGVSWVESHQEEQQSSLRAIILAIALSLHSVFEGLAIGLQHDVMSFLQICAAVLLHKAAIAISFGLNLVNSQLTGWAIVGNALVFSLASPIGVMCAVGLEHVGQSMSTSPLNGVLQGIACGTFFYVTFFEVLPHELNLGGNRMLKLLLIILGFSLVTGLLFLDPDNRKVRADFDLQAYSSFARL